MSHNASHKSKRLGAEDYILGVGWVWESWTKCETCGDIERTNGFQDLSS